MILFGLIFDTLLALAATIAILLSFHNTAGHVVCAVAFVIFIVNLRKTLFFIRLRRISNAARARYK